LSKLGWLEKNITGYTKAAHSMDKIVEFFDPGIEKIYKDEQGNLKIPLVVDWPHNVGILTNKEYTRFIENVKDSHEYHADTTEKIFQKEG
jgi:hypothetical protein